jgi:divalent metal cation (Fe/Co/Zn/Cd) transporter
VIPDASGREALVRRALRLEQLSIGWMLIEGAVSIAAGLLARSVALIGFGLDSALELISAVALYRRLAAELRGQDAEAAERAEKKALRVVGLTLVLLAGYIVIHSGWTLWTRSAPRTSAAGLVVAGVALVAMPLLGFAKRRIGRTIESRALIADAEETFACAWLSAATVLGVGLHTALGWWWADPVAALAMVPFIVREGREALEEAKGKKGCSR